MGRSLGADDVPLAYAYCPNGLAVASTTPAGSAAPSSTRGLRRRTCFGWTMPQASAPRLLGSTTGRENTFAARSSLSAVRACEQTPADLLSPRVRREPHWRPRPLPRATAGPASRGEARAFLRPASTVVGLCRLAVVRCGRVSRSEPRDFPGDEPNQQLFQPPPRQRHGR
jgi:hypothetical protein